MRRIPRTIRLGLAVAAAGLTSLTGPLATTGQAHAAVVGGCWAACSGETTISNTPGGTLTAVSCGRASIAIQPFASAQSGWVNGQYVAYRYNLQSNVGHNITSGWSGAKVVPYSTVRMGRTVTTPLTDLPGVVVSTATNLRWSVKVQYAYWQGSYYTYSGWYGPTNGYVWAINGPNTYYYSTCPT